MHSTKRKNVSEIQFDMTIYMTQCVIQMYTRSKENIIKFYYLLMILKMCALALKNKIN